MKNEALNQFSFRKMNQIHFYFKIAQSPFHSRSVWSPYYERLLSVDVRISPLIVDVQLHGVKQPKQYLAIVDSFDVEISCSKDIPKPRTPTPPPSGPIFITKITIQKAPTVQVSVEVSQRQKKCDASATLPYFKEKKYRTLSLGFVILYCL